MSISLDLSVLGSSKSATTSSRPSGGLPTVCSSAAATERSHVLVRLLYPLADNVSIYRLAQREWSIGQAIMYCIPLRGLIGSESQRATLYFRQNCERQLGVGKGLRCDKR